MLSQGFNQRWCISEIPLLVKDCNGDTWRWNNVGIKEIQLHDGKEDDSISDEARRTVTSIYWQMPQEESCNNLSLHQINGGCNFIEAYLQGGKYVLERVSKKIKRL